MAADYVSILSAAVARMPQTRCFIFQKNSPGFGKSQQTKRERYHNFHFKELKAKLCASKQGSIACESLGSKPSQRP